MKKVSPKIEFVANLFIILIGFLIAVTLVKDFLSPRTPAPVKSHRSGLEVGSKITLPSESTLRGSKNLIFALDVRCGYCNESANFYKRLVEDLNGTDINLIAVFRGPAEESTTYLESHGIIGVEVRQLPLERINVYGTPTLILTDEKGQITNFWVGKIPIDKESEVINIIRS